LHYALDKWFEEEVKPRCKGNAILYRYADDWLCCFQYKTEAEKFYRVVPKRLERFNLELEATKTQLLHFSRFHPSMKRRFTFLGFEFYWFIDRQNEPRLMRRTARKKLQGAKQRMKEWIRKCRSLPKTNFFTTLNAKLKGHYNYYYVSGNSESVWRFYNAVEELCFKWLNRRSQRKSLTWKQFSALWKRLGVSVPKARKVHNLKESSW
jgi:hypothetical protein